MKVKDLKEFVLSGTVTITIADANENDRHTYKIDRSTDGEMWWVGRLEGPNNETDYKYICCFRKNLKVEISPKSPYYITYRPVALFVYFMENISKLPPWLSVYPSGTCRRCERKLTVPKSIIAGFGPTCAYRLEVNYNKGFQKGEEDVKTSTARKTQTKIARPVKKQLEKNTKEYTKVMAFFKEDERVRPYYEEVMHECFQHAVVPTVDERIIRITNRILDRVDELSPR